MTRTDIRRLFGDGGHLTEEGVALYVDALKLGRVDELPPSMLGHVLECLDCKHEITGLFALVADDDRSPTEAHPYFDRTARDTAGERRIIYRAAAGIAVVFGLSALAYTLFFRSPDGPVTHPAPITEKSAGSTGPDSPRATSPAPRPSPREIAARFGESPQLEDMVQSTVRSEGATVDSPMNGTAVHRGASFRWSTSAMPPFTLSILDNHGHTVLSAQLDTGVFTLRDSLHAGLYYWKLTAEGDLLHVGKFIVR